MNHYDTENRLEKSDRKIMVIIKEENTDMTVKTGNEVHRFKKEDPEWQFCMNVPSYDDPNLVYYLMVGSFVEEYKALISHEVTRVIHEETITGTDSCRQLSEAYEIYYSICDILKTHCNIDDKEVSIFEKFYDLVHMVVRVFYKANFYNQSEAEVLEGRNRCQQIYDEMIDTLLSYKKRLKSLEGETKFDIQLQHIDELVVIFNLLVKRFYEKALEYGIYFRIFDRISHRIPA